jgi:hypothetical protein
MKKMLLLLALLCAPCAATLEPVAFVGDSLTRDTTFGNTDNLWWGQVSNSLNFLPHVFAREGQTAGNPTEPFFWNMGGAVVSYVPPLQDLWATRLFVLLGTNDWILSTTLADFTAAYSVMCDSWPYAQVVCVIPPPNAHDGETNTLGLTLDNYRAAIRQVCTGKIVVETQAGLPYGIRYFRDEYHLTLIGHTRLKNLVVAAM